MEGLPGKLATVYSVKVKGIEFGARNRLCWITSKKGPHRASL